MKRLIVIAAAAAAFGGVAVDEPWAADGIGWMRQNAVSTHC